MPPVQKIKENQQISHEIPLGESVITVAISRYKGEGKNVILHVHQNESASLAAAHAVAKELGGSVISICQAKADRYKEFKFGNFTVKFDPNRIFTDAGIERTLEFYQRGKAVKPDGETRRMAILEVCKFRAEMLSIVDAEIELTGAKRIVAAHNNYAGDRYFHVTRKEDEKALAAKGYTVAVEGLKDNDGSLSVYFAASRKSFPYVNVEAGYSDNSFQKKMLKAALGY
jgi:hypothetical protein